MVEYHTISTNDTSRLHHFWSKSVARYIPWICVTRGGVESGKETLIADIEELEQMDASEPDVHVNADERWKFHSPNRRWNSQNN